MRLLCVIEHGRAPSTRLRLADCLDRYRQAGIEATVISARRSSMAERLNVLRQAARHDVVVLFKTLSFSSLELTLLQRINSRIIFDFDDAIMFRSQKYRQPLRAKDFQKFLRTVRRCKAAVAGNDYLACFAEACGCPTAVLPTSVDVAQYGIKQHHDGHGLTIGWLGLSDGLVYLRHIQPALRRLAESFPGLKLKVISDKPLQLDGVVVENDEWRAETEQENLREFDIGIMPLWDSVWTRGKCGYKILQYMAAGIPAVASAVGANTDIILHGRDGFLARTQDDWVQCIASLIEDASLRRRLGASARDKVEKNYSLESFARGYIKLLHAVAEQKKIEPLMDRARRRPTETVA